ncbi:MAG: hypothetical protein H6830_05155 [Planctomycetes bacterium]|nr:hypothetical protein [Planctomycetota bacterium]MCB9909210.1 hypothetical protein [Planctomycetota bacterium]MCB9913308.1 hypothetical protein [Planctomycetota bacterium]HPF13236.1 hypothetical protein [Planctomycetota bacterium]HRV81232.1 hypothetical protein [Planctomycetota bacterium]
MIKLHSQGARRSTTALLTSCLLTLAACQKGDREAVLTRREPTFIGRPDVSLGVVTSEQRFGSRSPSAPADHAPHEMPDFSFDLPSTWKRIAGTQMRLLNFQIQGNEQATCYLSALGGNEQGVLDNVNRWRRQFGLPAIDSTELANLPQQPLFGVPGVRVACEGTFDDGMGGNPIEQAGLLGLIVYRQETLVFLKLVGPKAIVDQEVENFDRFSASLGLPGAGTTGAPASGAASGPASGERNLIHDAPVSWRLQAPRPMRKLGFDVGQDCDLSVTLLGGAAGGVALNMNRWRDQLDLPRVGEDAVDQLERVQILGAEGYWLDLTGSYKGMGDQVQIAEGRLMGAIVPLGDQTLFIKLVGPSDQVGQEAARLREFAQTLRWEDGQ